MGFVDTTCHICYILASSHAPRMHESMARSTGPPLDQSTATATAFTYRHGHSCTQGHNRSCCSNITATAFTYRHGHTAHTARPHTQP